MAEKKRADAQRKKDEEAIRADERQKERKRRNVGVLDPKKDVMNKKGQIKKVYESKN